MGVMIQFTTYSRITHLGLDLGQSRRRPGVRREEETKIVKTNNKQNLKPGDVWIFVVNGKINAL